MNAGVGSVQDDAVGLMQCSPNSRDRNALLKNSGRSTVIDTAQTKRQGKTSSVGFTRSWVKT